MNLKKKLIIIFSVVGALALATVSFLSVDIVRAKQFKLTLKAKSSETIIADGTSAVTFKVNLSRFDEPVEGHSIYIYVSNGSLGSARQVTDEDGNIKFTYYSYLYVNERVSSLDDVVFNLQDESNSLVFTIPAKLTFNMPVEKSDEGSIDKDWQGEEIIRS